MEKATSSARPRGGYLEAILQSSPYAVIAIDAKGIITFANKATVELLGCEMPDVIGKNIASFYENEEKARETNRKLYLAGGVIHDHESTIKSKTGKLIPVRISAAHIKDSSGNYIGGVGFFESYRPWTAAEAKLKEYCQQLEADIEEWRDLGAPVFEPLRGLSVTVIAGRLDAARFERVRKVVLDHIKVNKTRVALIDLSAAVGGDGAVATELLKTVRMVELVGASCVLVGIDSALARSLESLVVDVTSLNTYSSLDIGLEAALPAIGFEIVRKAKGETLGQDLR
jgi:PAS domain S-box-containing protein